VLQKIIENWFPPKILKRGPVIT